MAVYHFTLHAYRTWRPDNRRGYVRPGSGILKPDAKMAKQYDENAKLEPFAFDEFVQNFLIRETYEICGNCSWRLHAAAFEPSHYHFIVSWKEFAQWINVIQRIKNILSLKLGRLFDQPGGKWFVRGESRKRVVELKHFNHLVSEYLPSHRGVFWKEGMELPKIEDLGGLTPPAIKDLQIKNVGVRKIIAGGVSPRILGEHNNAPYHAMGW